MRVPDHNLPFFTYGIFRPGEIPFLGIKDFVESIESFEIKGEILIRDGVHLYRDGKSSTNGYLIVFKDSSRITAYEFIKSLEPKNLFRWEEKSFNQIRFNILVGKSPDKGSESINELHQEYSTLLDPYFTSAIEVLEEEKPSIFSWDLKGSFRIQMKYLFLWTILERFTFLRYSLGGNPSKRINQLAENVYFAEALQKYVNEKRKVFNTEDLGHHILERNNPKKSISYYYQIRNNLTHRGKSVNKDFKTIEKSFAELFQITQYILQKTKSECEEIKIKWISND